MVTILFGFGVPLRAVRPEPVEGLPFDRLRMNGVFLKRTVLGRLGNVNVGALSFEIMNCDLTENGY